MATSFSPEEYRSQIRTLEHELTSKATIVATMRAAVEAQRKDGTRAQEEKRALLVTNSHLAAANRELSAENDTLQVANANLTHIVDGIDHPTVLVDCNLRIVRVNRPFGGTFDLNGAAVGEPIQAYCAKFEDEAVILAELRRVIATGTWSQRQVKRHDGRWSLLRIFPLRGAGDPDGAIITFTDINGAKNLETGLQFAMSAARLVWWDWDFATGVIAVYGDAECILGYSVDTLPRTMQGWLAATHPEDITALSAATQQCIDGKTSDWSLVHRFLAADGTWRWVHNCGRAGERDAQGQPTRMLGITRDVHESHEASLALARDAAILGQLKDAVLSCDAEYRILQCNDAYERMFGWKRTEAVGQYALFRIPEPQKSDAQRYLDQVLRGESISVEWEDFRRDGSRIWVHWHAQPLLDANGRVVGTVNVATDMTERRRAAERHRELQHQLFHAQKMDTLGTLAGGIAHDFNNILAAIFGYAEIAAMQAGSDPNMQRLLQEILRAGTRGRELVKRILAFSRFHEPERRPVRLDEVIADAVKFMRASLASTVEITTSVPGRLPRISADPHQLCQVLLNLATNASHAMDHSGRFTLRVLMEECREPRTVATGVLKPGPYFAIEARDTGHGIDATTLPKIFDPFFTTKKEGEGTGLGLSVVRAIIEGHNGQIEVQSEPGKGTTFTVFLPRTEVTEPTEGKPDPRSEAPRGANQTIAIIDDEEMIAAATAGILQGLGYQTVTFPSAASFWESFKAAPDRIHGIITDQTMPRVTGLELVRRLREEGHRVPVLLVTGFNMQIRPEPLEHFENLATLRKPYDRHTLAQMVSAMVGTAAGRTPVAKAD